MPIPPDLQIFFPNGGTSAAQMYIWDGSKPIAWDGSISVSTSGGPIQDGVTPTILATVFDLANSNPLATQIVDANGDAITSFGGGTQYVDGSTHVTPTGTIALWLDAANVVRAVSATKPLPVDLITSPIAVTGPLTDTQLRASAVPISATSLPLPTGAATSALQQNDALTDTQLRATPIPISGTVTANAGTNLNTSALALETGGNLATIAGIVTTARAAVNPISGQSGVAGGSGTVGATTQRVVLATDVALPAGTNLLGQVSASQETSIIYNGTTPLTPKFAKIAASSSGNNNLVAAVTAKKLRVLGYNLISNGTVNAKFQSDGAGTPVDLTGLKYLVANTGISVGFSPVGWFESASGKSLDLNLSANIAVGGELVYIEV